MIGTRLLRTLVPGGMLILLIACGAGGEGEATPGPDGDGGAGPGAGPTSGGVIPVGFEDLHATPGSAAGQVVLAFRAPLGATATSYDVRVHVPHLVPDPASSHYAGHAPTWSVAHTPKSAGQTERLVLNGLEAGQTVQVAVRGMYPAGAGPFSHGLGVRVPGPLHPTPPGDAIAVSAPRSLDAPGYYLVTQDISAPGTAFTITSQNVTLDLGGHTVTYGTAPGTNKSGVYSEYLTEPGTIIVRNGTLRQGAGNGTNCAGIHFRAGYNLRFSGLTCEAHGNDTSPIQVYDNPRGTLRIDHCHVKATTTVVVDRHFPGVAAIWLGAITESVEIDHNEISASPQWGIKVQGNASNGHAWIHHNRIAGTKSLYANSYMIGVHKAKTDVFENDLNGESRGIHIDGDDNFGNDCEIHDNSVRSQDLPNAEYPQHWTHGIKIESGRNAHVHHNAVLSVADAQHSEAIALDVSLGTAKGVRIHDNRFFATSTHQPFLAKAFSWSGGADAPPADIIVTHNIFRATDQMVHRGWASLGGGTFRDNVWTKDTAKGPSTDVIFERIDLSDLWPSPGHKFVDSLTTLDTTRMTQWANPAAYDSERYATLQTRAIDTAGNPIVDATVELRDRENAVVASGTTDDKGAARATVLLTRITKGPAIDSRGPFSLRVTAPQGSFTGSQSITGRTALQIVLSDTPEVIQDTTAPSAPEALTVQVLSATRIRARWTQATDPSGIVGYQVFVNEELVAYAAATTGTSSSAIISGLTPGSRPNVRVKAVDAAGLISPMTAATAADLPADDRGP